MKFLKKSSSQNQKQDNKAKRVAVNGGATDDDDNRYTRYRAIEDVQVIGALASTSEY